MGILSHLEPKSVFDYFERLCAVPHGSGNTKIISDLCVTMAKELGLRYRQEDCNNVIIWKDASPGYENAAPVILQGHMDMVCAQTEDCPKDMTREGLDLATDGRYVWAEKTSLGGDDCIAVAAAFAILADNSLSHPPLEVVITVDEETGMDGAVALDCSDLKGRRLLNLDSEEEGVFTVSCAGGLRADCFVPAAKEPLTDEACFAVSIGGLKGGHSGAEIDKGRGSGNDLISRVLYSAMERLGTLRIADLRGGQFDNVICTRCDAVVAVPAGKAEDFAAFIREFDGILKNEYAATDGGVTLTCAAADTDAAYSAEDSSRLLHVLLTLPQGVEVMSADFPGLVQTSLNLGVMTACGDGLHFSFSIRSSVATQKELLLQRVRAIVEYTGGGTVSTRGDYPAWQYARQSPLRDTVMASYKQITGQDGVIMATHGGLECGLLINKMPGLDAVSLGPELHDIHSPRERLGVDSVKRMYALVCEVLKNCR